MGLKNILVLGYLALYLVILSPISIAHSNVLYNINLDFDQDLKNKVVKVAHGYLGKNEKPIKFDYDRELLVVHFSDNLERSVTINPEGYLVFGQVKHNNMIITTRFMVEVI